MATAPLTKIRFAGAKEKLGLFLQELQKKGTVHLSDLSDHAPDEGIDLPGFDTARVDFLLQLLRPYTPKAKALAGDWVVTDLPTARTKSQSLKANFDALYEKAEAIESEKLQTLSRQKEIEKELAQLAPFAGLEVPVGVTQGGESVSLLIAETDSKSFDVLLEQLSESTPLYDIVWSNKSKKGAAFAIAYHADGAEAIAGLKNNFRLAEPAWWNNASYAGKTTDEAIEMLKGAAEKLEEKTKKGEESLKEMAGDFESLKVFSDFSRWKDEAAEAGKKSFVSDNLFVVDGWTESADVKSLTDWANKAFAGEVIATPVSAEELAEPDAEVVPVKANNGALVRPFEALTNMYGSPTSDDIDPTPSLSPFFLVFFGICLSDVGYGLILFILGLVYLLFGTLSQQQRDMYTLIFMCGISAMIGGVLLGGYFGMTAEQLPAFMINQSGGIKGALIDPIAGQGPLRFLVFSLAIGLFQLISGVVVQFYKNIKQKNYGEAFFNSLPWFVFLITGIAYALTAAGQLDLPTEPLKYATMATAGALVLCLGRKASLPMVIPKGILGLYGVMDYVSDTLSYSRLMALGLATGVIAFSMNTTAGVLYDMIGVPVISHAVAAVVLVFGHALNFGLSLLGASIHSMRLQFIEFFKRFYEGGGQAFEPFARRARYILFRS